MTGRAELGRLPSRVPVLTPGGELTEIKLLLPTFRKERHLNKRKGRTSYLSTDGKSDLSCGSLIGAHCNRERIFSSDERESAYNGKEG